MSKKPTYEELEKRVAELEAKAHRYAQLQSELKRNLNFTESLLASIPTPIFYKDARGRYQGCNRAFTQIMGVTSEQIRGKTVQDLWPSEHAQVYHQKDLELLENPQFQVYEFKVKDKRGEIRPVIYYKDVFRDENGNVAGLVGGFVDISNIRQAMKELDSSRRLLLSVLEAVPDLLVVIDRDYRILYSNNKGHDRIAPPEDEMSRTCYGRFKYLDAPCEDCSAASVFAEGKAVERKMVNPVDGRIREVRAFPIFDATGRVINVVEYVRDITDIKQAQDEIRQRQQFLESVLYHAPDAIITLDEHHRVIDWNPGAVKMFGYTPDEATGEQLDDLVARHQHHAEAGSKTAQVLSGRRVDAFETIRYRKDGTPLNVIAAGSPIMNDGKLEGVVAVYTDITDRVRSEEALKTSHQSFITVLDSIDATIYVADMSTHEILFMNKHMIETFGGDMTGKICWEVFREESAPCPHCTNDRLVDDKGNPTGVVVWQGQNPVSRKWYMNYDRAIEWIDGRLVRIQIATDITELKRLEEGLRQAQKMEAVGTLAGGIAHDFNNMLGTILGRTELALLEMAPGDPKQTNLREIHGAAKRSADLTKQLLAFARKQAISPKVLDLNNVVEDSLKMLRRLIGEDVDLVWHPDTKLWSAKIDPIQIDQILANLCVNARDAISGVGSITIETKNLVLDQDYCDAHAGLKPGEYVMLAVSDDGCGMDRHTLDNAFEPFFTTKEVGEGTGLGLSTVYGIVKQNDGYINVASELGSGTTFNVYLPKVVRTFEKKDNAPGTSIAKGTETVLVAEDEESVLSLIKSMLERCGYTVLAVQTPSQALEIAESFEGEIHLLITDVVMPEMNGNELKERIVHCRPDIKVLFMSGYTNNTIMDRGVLQNNTNFLQKPFSMDALAGKVRTVLDQSEESSS